MTTESKLPHDVLEAIHANRKIDAIKLLREHRSLGLKEAKHAVDAYIRENRHLLSNYSSGSGTGFGRLLLVGLALFAAYVLIRQFA